MLFPWLIRYPYVNDEILNLDWLTSEVKTQVEKMNTFINLNTIKYADPILWNITTQYETNTVVVDPVSGTAYISVQPVPSGIGLNNTDYWTVIFTMDIMSANKNITIRDDANNPLATFESNVDDWLISQGNLYIVIRQIDIGEAYVVDYNIERRTVEDFLKAYITDLKVYVDTLAGDLDDLNTTDKTNLVAAINEVLGAIATIAGDLDDLNTTDKTNLVAAINEVLSTLTNTAGDLDDLDTTDKTSLVAAINEVLTTLTNTAGDLDDLDTTDQSNLVAAINEVLTTLTNTTGDLDDLDTTDKTSLVAAINETLEEATKSKGLINVKDYGAVGDGVTNDTAAFTAALADCKGGDILFIPAGAYIINSSITINKPITILGGGGFPKRFWNGTDSGSNLIFAAGAGIVISSTGVHIEGLYLRGHTTGIGIEIVADSEIGIGSICGSIRNVCIVNYQRGVLTHSTFKTVFENVYCYNCEVGFESGNTSTESFTSFTLINCWMANCTHGYRLYQGVYSSLINCASDNCGMGYELYGCGAMKLLNCGVEHAASCPILLDACNTVVVDGAFATGCGDTTYVSSVCRIQDNSSNCTITNCIEHDPQNGAYAVVDGTGNLNFIFNNNFISRINKGGIVSKDYTVNLTVRP